MPRKSRRSNFPAKGKVWSKYFDQVGGHHRALAPLPMKKDSYGIVYLKDALALEKITPLSRTFQTKQKYRPAQLIQY
jgi:hypothetical protein